LEPFLAAAGGAPLAPLHALVCRQRPQAATARRIETHTPARRRTLGAQRSPHCPGARILAPARVRVFVRTTGAPLLTWHGIAKLPNPRPFDMSFRLFLISALVAVAAGQTCPSSPTATSCNVGVVGPSAALVALNATGLLSQFGIVSPTQVPTPVSLGQPEVCFQLNMPCCFAIQLIGEFNVTVANPSTACPTGQSVSISFGLPTASCAPVVSTLTQAGVGSSLLVVTGTNNSNIAANSTYTCSSSAASRLYTSFAAAVVAVAVAALI
jgi:hypothetical protein